MAITLVSAGAYVNGTNTTITAVAGSFIAGDALFLFTGEYLGSQMISTPAGWTAIDKNVNAQQTRVFAKIAVGSDTIPGITWGSGSIAWAYVVAFRGVDSSFTTGATANDRAAFTTSPNIIGPASATTPSVNNCLVLLYGQRNKTAVTDATVYSADTGFTMLSSQVRTGTNSSNASSYWIQTTATTVPANSVIDGTVTESTNQSQQAGIIVLRAAVGGVGGSGSRFGLMGVGS